MQRQAERLPRSRNRGRPCNSEAARRFTSKAFGAGSAAATGREAAEGRAVLWAIRRRQGYGGQGEP